MAAAGRGVRGDLLAQPDHVFVQRHAGGAERRLARQAGGALARQAQFYAGVFEQFDEVEKVSRAASRDRGNRTG